MAWRTAWSRSHFLKSNFTSSLLGEEENVVLQCKLGHTVLRQSPKNNLWSVLWASRAGACTWISCYNFGLGLSSFGKRFLFQFGDWGGCLGVFWGGEDWGFYLFVCLFNVFKYACISTFGFLQMEKPVSNTHSVQFKGLYMFLIITYLLFQCLLTWTLWETWPVLSVSCHGSLANNYRPSPLLLLRTDLTRQTSSFGFKSIAWSPMESFEHLYLFILIPGLEPLCENCPVLILSIQHRCYSGAS